MQQSQLQHGGTLYAMQPLAPGQLQGVGIGMNGMNGMTNDYQAINNMNLGINAMNNINNLGVLNQRQMATANGTLVTANGYQAQQQTPQQQQQMLVNAASLQTAMALNGMNGMNMNGMPNMNAMNQNSGLNMQGGRNRDNNNNNNHNSGNNSGGNKSKNDFDPCNLYVKGLWKECNQIDLDDIFKKYGVINQSRVYGDGVGFVRFDDPKCAAAVEYLSLSIFCIFFFSFVFYFFLIFCFSFLCFFQFACTLLV